MGLSSEMEPLSTDSNDFWLSLCALQRLLPGAWSVGRWFCLPRTEG